MSGIIITTASWEVRFKLGLIRLVETKRPNQVFAFYFKEYAEQTKGFRDDIIELCEKEKIKLNWLELSFADPAESWRKTYNFLTSIDSNVDEIQVDISTMPREIIWTVFNILSEMEFQVSFVYSQPESYNQEWLSQEPGRPRIVYKMGGISKLNVSNILLIQTGYDIDRIDQIINEFNPDQTLLAIQTGKQFDNENNNKARCEEYFSTQPNVKIFEVDAYSDDHGLTAIEKQITPFLPTHNILVTSVGPKLGAVALFKLYKKYSADGLGLIYAPSEKFNPDYSYGIGESFVGHLA